MTDRELATRPLLRLRLRGTQAEMGAQQGALLRRVGGYEQTAAFYPLMAARMLTMGVPHGLRAPSERAAQAVLNLVAGAMHRKRQLRFPEYTARTEAMLEAGGVGAHMAKALLVMEVLQNTVGLLGRAGALPSARLSLASLPACSSLAVWGESSGGGELRHARNFDFPGAGVWDLAPVVAFCEPDEGLRYGFVTTRGADVPGITAFNEAGLTLTVHTRFHREVRFDRAPVFDLGHEIVRRARTLGEAVDIAKKVGAASTWGILISSASERSACVVETTADQVAVTEPGAGASHLACTNHYFSRTLRKGSLSPSHALTVNSHARLARLEQRVAERAHGLGAEELELTLANLSSPDARDGTPDVVRLAGDCVVSPVTVKSIVAEPEQGQMRVSVGQAPTAFGPYQVVPWSWDGEVAADELAAPDVAPRAHDQHGQALSARHRRAVHAFADIARMHFEDRDPREVRAALERLVQEVPNEPHFRTLAAYCALSARDLETALVHLDAALVLEHGAWRRGRLLLFKVRVLKALARDAEPTREELLALRVPETIEERDFARRERTQPLSKARLCKVVADFHLVDGRIPGVAV
jgi:hypothetical protein